MAISDDMFTLHSYEALLDLAQMNGYAFLSFDDPQRFNDRAVCLLRHDIDVDLGAAVQLAEIEAKAGIKATYFLMLRSPVYNLFSRSNHRFVERLLVLGHYLGLHYDEGFQPAGDQPLGDLIYFEADILGRTFGVQVKSVSFHQPSPAFLERNLDLPGLINTYNREDLRGFTYLSDSNKSWVKGSPLSFFAHREPLKIHLLIHPIWWNYRRSDLTTEAIWDLGLLANWNRCQEQLLATERAYGGPRRFQIQNECP